MSIWHFAAWQRTRQQPFCVLSPDQPGGPAIEPGVAAPAYDRGLCGEDDLQHSSMKSRAGCPIDDRFGRPGKGLQQWFGFFDAAVPLEEDHSRNMTHGHEKSSFRSSTNRTRPSAVIVVPK